MSAATAASGVIAAAGGGWTPAFPGSLRAWYRYGVGLLNGSSAAASSGEDVMTWQDQSGNGHHVTQATSGKRPLWTQGTGVIFSAANQDYLHSGDSGGLSGNFNHSVFALLNTGTIPTSFSSMVSYGRSDSGLNNSVIGTNGVAGSNYWFGGGAGVAPQENSVSADNTTIRLGKVHSGTTTQGYRNGATAGSSASVTYTIIPRGVLLNSRDSVLGFSNVTLIEVVVYDKALSAPEIASLDAYFVARAAAL
jgi:hypothetical protein